MAVATLSPEETVAAWHDVRIWESLTVGADHQVLSHPAGNLLELDGELTRLCSENGDERGMTWTGYPCSTSCCNTAGWSQGHCCEGPE